MKEFIEKLIGRLEKIPVGFICCECPNILKCNEIEDSGMGKNVDLCGATIKQLAIEIVNQLAEEYKGEELRKSQKIYNFIKQEINPYGKPFEGTVYEFGLKVMKYITNLHTKEYNNDFCEWKSEKDMFIQNPHTGRMFSNEPSMKNIYCNTCGKKIKIAPYQQKGENNGI